MSCFIDFIDINLWEDKVREIHLDKSRLKKGYSKPLQNKMALPTCAGTPTTAIPARTFKGPVFKPCLQTLKPGKWVQLSSRT